MTNDPLRPVTGTRQQGRRVYLQLGCGHERLHNPRISPPTRAHCIECPTQETSDV